MSLLYGLQKQGEAYLLPTLGLPGHRYQSINQLTQRISVQAFMRRLLCMHSSIPIAERMEEHLKIVHTASTCSESNLNVASERRSV